MKNVAVTNFYKAITKEMKKRKKKIQKEVPARFELTISCLLDRRFNQLSHGTLVIEIRFSLNKFNSCQHVKFTPRYFWRCERQKKRLKRQET